MSSWIRRIGSSSFSPNRTKTGVSASLNAVIFQARMEKEPENKNLVIFCRQADQISPALEEFNAMESGLDSIFKLLKQIYHLPPWEVSPAVSEDDLRKNAAEILDAFSGGAGIEANFD